jgi:RNA polymerase sigma-70 factor (ECF subfamily)
MGVDLRVDHPNAEVVGTETDESALVRLAQIQNQQAQAELIERYWPRLFRWLYQLTRDRHLAEDLAQEAFLKALANLERFQVGTNFRAWLFRIAHNSLANVQRSPSRRREVLPEEVPARKQDPSDLACSRETLAAVAAAIDRLPCDWRAALLLRVEEDLSFRQIAGVLNTTEETARWRVFKARQRLLAELEDRLELEES